MNDKHFKVLINLLMQPKLAAFEKRFAHRPHEY